MEPSRFFCKKVSTERTVIIKNPLKNSRNYCIIMLKVSAAANEKGKQMNVYDFDGTIFYSDCSIGFALWCVKRHPKLLFTYVPGLVRSIIRHQRGKIPNCQLQRRMFSYLTMIDDLTNRSSGIGTNTRAGSPNGIWRRKSRTTSLSALLRTVSSGRSPKDSGSITWRRNMTVSSAFF